jgi:tRNA A-37 threonylcarbamoyl transferase component Bud32
LYFVNWQRDISIEERDGLKVVVKRNKPTKEFHELLITYTYSLISILLAHPSSPDLPKIMANEGHQTRLELAKLGIPTPRLMAISDEDLVEEYIEGGDLYGALSSSGKLELASSAGVLTGRLHVAGQAFIDNKAQNYLVRDSSVMRTDLGFTKKARSEFARSMDIGSFLASTMDLNRYPEIERAFYEGYVSETGRKFSTISIVIRNLLSLGFSSNGSATFQNMLLDSRPILEI